MRRIRRWIARPLGLLVFCVTLGRITIDWQGDHTITTGADLPAVEAERSPDQRD